MARRNRGGWWTKERQQRAYSVLREKAGLTDAGARGLVSRWANVESRQGPTSLNPISGAFGIHQGLGRRKPTSADFEDQLAHVVAELNDPKKEKRAGDMLRSAETFQQGAVGASAFERAEGYSKRTKRDNFVNATLRGMPHIATAAAPAAKPAGGLLASFFSDPLGMQAHADEMPQGLGAQQQAQTDYFGSVPTTTWGAQREEALRDHAAARAKQQAKQAAPGLMAGGLGGGMMGSIGIDVPGIASTEDDAQRMERQAGMYQPASKFTGSAVAPDFSPTRSSIAGLMAHPAMAQQAPTDPTQATAGFQGGQIGAPKQDQNGGIMSSALAGLGAALGPHPAVAEGFKTSPDGKIADPFGNYAPGGRLATVQKFDERAPGAATAYAPPDQPGSIHVGGLQPIGATESIKGTTPPDLNAISLAMAQGVMKPMAQALTQTPQQPTIAPPDKAQTAETTFPDAPAPPSRTQTARAKMAAALDDMGLGFVNQIGDTFNQGLGSLREGLSQGLGSGPAAMGGPNYGSGLAAMQQAMSGPTGGMAQSRSNPGYSFQKTATGGVRYGPKGWQALDASGEQSGGLHPYDGNMGLGGYLSGLFDGIGGLGRTEGKSKGKGGRGKKSDVDHDHGRGLGAGLY